MHTPFSKTICTGWCLVSVTTEFSLTFWLWSHLLTQWIIIHPKSLIHTVVRTQDWSEQVSHWRAKLQLLGLIPCEQDVCDETSLRLQWIECNYIRLPQQTCSKSAWATSRSALLFSDCETLVQWLLGLSVLFYCSWQYARLRNFQPFLPGLICCSWLPHISV